MTGNMTLPSNPEPGDHANIHEPLVPLPRVCVEIAVALGLILCQIPERDIEVVNKAGESLPQGVSCNAAGFDVD